MLLQVKMDTKLQKSFKLLQQRKGRWPTKSFSPAGQRVENHGWELQVAAVKRGAGRPAPMALSRKNGGWEYNQELAQDQGRASRFFWEENPACHNPESLSSRPLHLHLPGHTSGSPRSSHGCHWVRSTGLLLCSRHPASEHNCTIPFN